jgi:hypothetical protein
VFDSRLIMQSRDHDWKTDGIRWSVVVASAMVLVSACSPYCGPGPSPAPSSPSTSSVNASTNFPSQGAQTCTGTATWTYSPGTLTGSAGTSTTVTHTQTYANIFPSGGFCTFSDSVLNLKIGTWTVSVSAGIASGSCTEKLHGGTNAIGFNYGTAGCTLF